MVRWANRILPIFILLALLCQLGFAGPFSRQRERRHFAWGRFARGSWQKVRITTEIPDDLGQLSVSSVTEKKTVLDAIDDDGIRLRVESTVNVGGKSFEAPIEEVVETHEGWSPDADISREAETDELRIGLRRYPCTIRTCELTHDGRKTVVRNWVSPDAPGVVLKSDTTVYDAQTDEVLEETVSKVISRRELRKVLRTVRQTSEVETVCNTKNGRIVGRSWMSPGVPGGIVEKVTEEFDANNRLVRRITLQMVDYDAR